MDKIPTPVGLFGRQFPSRLPVELVGYMPGKKSWVRRAFGGYNFSFIFEGHGRIFHNDDVLEVFAPCVIVQPNGLYLEYGPDEQWDELYISYNVSAVPFLQHCGFIDPKRLVWPIHNERAILGMFAQLDKLVSQISRAGVCDRIDRLCESMILESLLVPQQKREDPVVLAVEEALAFVHRHYTEDVDWRELASRHNLAYATFRRHWGRIVNLTPGKYLTHLRVQEACRLLAETDLQIGQVAKKVGYEDPLYFSRQFRQWIGMTAREYRSQNRL